MHVIEINDLAGEFLTLSLCGSLCLGLSSGCCLLFCFLLSCCFLSSLFCLFCFFVLCSLDALIVIVSVTLAVHVAGSEREDHCACEKESCNLLAFHF